MKTAVSVRRPGRLGAVAALGLLMGALSSCADVKAAALPMHVSDVRVAPAEGGVRVSLAVTGSGQVYLPRNPRQNCATAPHVRILEVGTRRVVYPVNVTPGALCTQDVQVLAPGQGDLGTPLDPEASGTVWVERVIALPPGHYIVESWIPATGELPQLKAPYRAVRF